MTIESETTTDPRHLAVAGLVCGILIGECVGIATERYRLDRVEARARVDAGPPMWIQTIGADEVACEVEQ